MNKNKPIVWTISGHDPSGGAGIAADLRTIHCFAVEACAFITANTVQNSEELLTINPVDIKILEQQYQLLIEDKLPDAIKIGMVATDEQIYWLIEKIAELKADNVNLVVVYDPVAAATVGGVTTEVTKDALHHLFSVIDVLTPNMTEAEKLTGIYLGAVDDIADKFSTFGINNTVIKGGHTDEEFCVDYGYQFSEPKQLRSKYSISSERINTDYTHGGGCSFASAIAALLSKGYLLRDALTITKAFMQQGMIANDGRIQYYGAFEQTELPTKPSIFPQIELTQPLLSYPTSPFAELGMKRDGNQSLGLYPVVDSIEWLEKLLPLELTIIQLRVKNKPENELDAIIERAVELANNYPNTRLFINDHWQLAIKHRAYGIHLGQEDIYQADLAKIQQSGIRLGISTHGIYEFLLAQQLKPSYLAIGAIFPTKTKDMTGQIQGLTNLKQILNISTDIPVVAIGGINLTNASDVWSTSVDSIAVVTAITQAECYIEATKRLKAIANNYI
ncbi:thiamine phosphate synthase [Thalassotalea algicola]|nr:thiamine phosphate synthase [Thalassotalea algicola]